jgi:hypothetical protein
VSNYSVKLESSEVFFPWKEFEVLVDPARHRGSVRWQRQREGMGQE